MGCVAVPVAMTVARQSAVRMTMARRRSAGRGTRCTFEVGSVAVPVAVRVAVVTDG